MINRNEKSIWRNRAYIDAKSAYLIELISYVIQKILSKIQVDLYAKWSDIFNIIHFSSWSNSCFAKSRCNSNFDVSNSDFLNFDIAFLTKIFAMSSIFVLNSRYQSARLNFEIMKWKLNFEYCKLNFVFCISNTKYWLLIIEFSTKIFVASFILVLKSRYRNHILSFWMLILNVEFWTECCKRNSEFWI